MAQMEKGLKRRRTFRLVASTLEALSFCYEISRDGERYQTMPRVTVVFAMQLLLHVICYSHPFVYTCVKWSAMKLVLCQ